MNEYLISSLSQQWKKDPKSRVFFRLAEEYRKGEAYEKALSVLKEGIEHHPEYLPAKVCLGRCYQSLGQLEQAESVFKTVLQTAPDNPHALGGLGSIHAETKRYQEAITYYQTLAIHDPTDESVDEKIAEIERRMNEPEPAADNTPSASSNNVKAPPSGKNTGAVEGEKPMDDIDKEFEKAMRAANQPDAELFAGVDVATTKTSADSLVLSSQDEEKLTKGLKHEKMEHFEAAQHVYRTLLNQYPRDATVGEHLERVNHLIESETKGRRKIRILSNWLDKIKGNYYVR